MGISQKFKSLKANVKKRHGDYQVKKAKKDYAKGQKRAEKLGMPFSAYAVAVSQAQAKGQQKAQKEKQLARYKEVEQQAYFKAGGKVGKPESLYESFMNPKHKKTIKKAVKTYRKVVNYEPKAKNLTKRTKKTKRKTLTNRTKKRNNGTKDFFDTSNIRF